MEHRIIQTPLILLAGGASSRMGKPKGLLPFGPHFWIEEQLHRFAFSGNKAVIVLGHDHETYLQRIPALKEALHLWVPWPSRANEELQLSVTINPRPELGSFSSLKKGLDRLLPESEAFVSPIDVPVPTPEVWRQLETAGLTRKLDACIPEHQGKRGHPVWLSADFLRRLRALSPESVDARLDRQIAELDVSKRATLQVADPKVTWNINTPEEYEKLKVIV